MLKKFLANKWSHLILFSLTIITTTCSGASHLNIHEVNTLNKLDLPTDAWSIQFLLTGLTFSLSFLFVLSVHEFGHYFTAKYHKIKTSLPYYIPFIFPLGTMGAVIQLKEKSKRKKHIFDVGVAGPIAGFIAAIALLTYGFQTLPPAEEIYKIHPQYEQYGSNYAEYAYEQMSNEEKSGSLVVGTSLLFEFFKKYVANDPANVPNQYELMHYPFIFAGFLSLFFTALNLLPIGQLDGGHVLYGLIGDKQFRKIVPYLFSLMVLYAGLGSSFLSPLQNDPFDFILYAILYLGFLYFLYDNVFKGKPKSTAIIFALSIFVIQFASIIYFPTVKGYNGWLLYCFLLARVMGIYHPPAEIEAPLNTPRKIVGWVALLIFIICFSPQPLLMQ